jgi:hypothetical protein
LAPGAWRLIIEATPEDLAENKIGKPFKVDLNDGVWRRLSTTTVKLLFKSQYQRRKT